jgi:hypothetical protein
MNPNLTALLKSSVALFLLYWLIAYALVIPEYIYLFMLRLGMI